MAKQTTAYVCQSCGAKHPKYTGKCSECGEWNTIVEEIQEKNPHTEKLTWKGELKKKEKARPTLLTNIVSNDNVRLDSQNGELNRVLGGGIVAGSIVLIGGEPGIGKSTLMLQVALAVKGKVLYVSGEESEEQIKMRADRIDKVTADCYIYAETHLTSVLLQAANLNPDVLVIDSIQTLYASNIESPAGSVSQIRECAGQLQRYAKETNTPVFVIGHINKDGDIAGPKLLEHIVDVVLQFEGDRNYTYRILRTIKNRFGSTAELGIFEMHGSGLREVSNPSELFLSQREEDLSGSTISSFLEGVRPMLIETQALVSKSVYSSPQRSATGFDTRRLGMLLAVLEKRCGFLYSAYDVFLNIAGGIKVNDPAIDLSIVAALISSLQDVSVPANVCFAGEIGLSGEIRTVQRIEQRIAEADRLGFKKMFVSKYNMKGLEAKGYKIEIVPLAKIEDLYNKLFK